MGTTLVGARMRPPRTTTNLIAGALLLLGASTALAQTGTLTGRVTDARSAQPVAGAVLEVEGARLRTIADADGRYRIAAVPPGTHTLVVRRIGYAVARQPVTVAADAQVTADVALQAAPVWLDQIVVTGTAIGERRRSIGSSVATINAVEAVELAVPPNFTSLLNARAPGVVINQVTGRLGASPSINIRGRSSIGLGNSPLVYIDGVRVNSNTGLGAANGGLGAQGSSVAGRLNDINPEDIESIEVIKGPAAATIYGTEASSGVIQIITKKGVIGAKPQFSMQVHHGSIFFRNADGRVPTNYRRDPGGTIVPWNAIQQEKDRGTPIYKTGRSTGYSGALSGGRDQLRYYASASFDDETGIEPNNYGKQFSLHTNLSVAASPKIDFGASLNYVDLRNHLGTDNGLSATLGATLGHILLQPASRGFGLGYPPELSWNLYDNTEFANRFTTSGTVNYRATDWLTQRLLLGVDYTGGDNRTLERFAPPALAVFLTPTQAAGRIGQTLRRNIELTADYAGTASLDITPAFSAASSIGLQVARTEANASSLGGMGFPAPGIETVSGAATPLTSSQSQLINTTVGAYAQEKFGWNDRLFATVALRVDNNSAFGANYKWVTYPKADVAWVISEEPFWRWSRYVNTFRLRAAYGESGRAPNAFSALRTFSPVQGPGGTTAVTPGSLGNPNLKPERGKEVELGFETTILDRFGLDFTYFSKKTVDEIVNQSVAPSSGFPGSIPLNLGRVDNSGLELLATIQALTRRDLKWDIIANVSTTKDEIKDLGIVPGSITSYGGSNRVGYPIGGFWSKRVVSADRDPTTQLATNVLCDGGPGNPPVACATAPFVYLGTPTPKVSGAISNTITIARNLRLYAMVDFKRGNLRFSNDEALRCTGAAGGAVCHLNFYPEQYSPVLLAEAVGTALAANTMDQYFMDASFTKLREVSASYALPTRFIPGVSQASITLSGRELATWTNFGGTDPENSSQAIVPPLSRFTASLNIRF